jgi:hypothetical protein
MLELNLKPTHKAVKDYYAALGQLNLLHASEEGVMRSAFQSLLSTCASQFHWTLRTEYPIRRRQRGHLAAGAASPRRPPVLRSEVKDVQLRMS